MKKFILSALVSLFIITESISQTGINNDGISADPSAMLDIKSTTQGILLPRLTTSQRDSVLSPATGLLVFNKTTNKFNCFNGTDWNQLETLFLTVSMGTVGQGGGVSISTSPSGIPDNSAILDIDNQNRGILIPRTSPAQITNPTEGLIIYNTSSNLLNFYNGSQWIALCTSSTSATLRTGTQAQAGVAINNTGALPHQSAILDVSSATRGMLIPRLNQTQRDIILPAKGLIIYNKTSRNIEFFNGTGWAGFLLNPLAVPVPGIQTAISATAIVWTWNPVPGATGFRWNTVNDYSTATELGSATSFMEENLLCGRFYKRYVWAYNNCCISEPLTLRQATWSCPVWTCGDALTDLRDGHVYSTVLIKNKCWLQENLNLGTKIGNTLNQLNNGIVEKYCYNNLDSNCNIYGGLYQFGEMMDYSASSNATPSGRKGICMDGWHVPSDAEWCQMMKYVDPGTGCSLNFMGGSAAAVLKETGTTHWLNPNVGATNATGFTALPGGNRNGNASFFDFLGYFCYFWSSTESVPERAISRLLGNSGTSTYIFDYNKTWGQSLRCVKDDSCFAPQVPVTGNHVPGLGQIVWNWNHIYGATGYKWNTVNDLATAVDVGLQTSYTETGLLCSTNYTRYLWAVGDCGTPDFATMNASTWPCPTCSGFTDVRNGKPYNTILIGTQCWMKENLDIGTMISNTISQSNNNIIEKHCYNNLTSSCDTYGGLYQWAELVQYLNGATNTSTWNPAPAGPVTGLCPDGWHIPEESDFNLLVSYLQDDAGGKLKEPGFLHWISPNTGATNSSGFTALGSGFSTSTSCFYLNMMSGFWSKNEVIPSMSSMMNLNYNIAYSTISPQDKSFGASVRCIKDCALPTAPASGNHIPSFEQIIWKWSTVPFATGYKWNTVNDFSTSTDMGTTLIKYETGLNCNTTYMRYVWAYNACGNSSPVTLSCQTSAVTYPGAPAAGIHVATANEITWNWNPVSGATGYKWNTTNNFSTALDLSSATTKTESDLTCNAVVTRYVWAYCACGYSPPVTLSQSTTACPFVCGQPFTDERDAKTYGTVLIGSQCWMKENLNVGSVLAGTQEQTNNGILEKYCYNNLESNCNIYGGLYQWGETVQYLNGASNASTWNPIPGGNIPGICPSGWHLPSDADWCQMEAYLDNTVNCSQTGWIGTDLGGKMKETGYSHWMPPNAGATNSSGFTALPGGRRNENGTFSSINYFNMTWGTENTSTYPTLASFREYAYYTPKEYKEFWWKTYGFSVRCIKN